MPAVTLTMAALQKPQHIVSSAWLEHAPFLSWMIEQVRPHRFVELGTHRGYSYFAACETVKILGLGTNCHAIDTFAGDEHAGFYDHSIYDDVCIRNADYAGFSSIHQMTFADALEKFDDCSIDILHIDGRHFYADVKEDYETWSRKLTPDAVVLFHDTNVRERDFGVWKLFSELKARHPSFEFFHNHGLGVIAPGAQPPALSGLFSMGDEAAAAFRRTMETLGERLSLRYQLNESDRALHGAKAETDFVRAELASARDEEHARRNEADRLRSELGLIHAQCERLENEIAEQAAREKEIISNTNLLRDRLTALETSTLWRATSPVRGTLNRIPVPLRRYARGSLRAAYWVVTPHRTMTRIRHFRALAAKRGFNGLVSSILLEPPVRSTGYDPLDRGDYARWIENCDTVDDNVRRTFRKRLNDLSHKPLISIVMPVYNTPEDLLREAVASVRTQIYENWELCIADDASAESHVARVLKELKDADGRIKIVTRETNGHIALASNSALAIAQGEFVALMDHDDVLPEHALFEVVVAINGNPDAAIIYTDEDKIDENGQRFDPYFKPDFSYDQLLGQNLISHFGVYRRSLLKEIGGFRDGFTGSQDYDLALRSVAASDCQNVVHIPKVLYHWRQMSTASSFSQSDLNQCISSSRRALRDHLDGSASAEGKESLVLENPIVPVWNRVKFPMPAEEPSVTVIIPTRDRSELLRQCANGLLRRTDYRRLEVIVVDNDSVEPETFKLFEDLKNDERVSILPVAGDFNYSRLNNIAAADAEGEILLLLNNDIDVIKPDWLTELVSHAIRPDVGCVGAKLLYADGRVQHAGVRLGAGHFDGGRGVGSHIGLFSDRWDIGYFGSYAVTRDVGCVTAACLAVRKDVYAAVDGLDEVNLKVAFNDVDFCLRVREAGYRIIWTPFAELYHLESASRGTDQTPEKHARFMREARYMRDHWGPALDSDPFYNPNFDNYEADYYLDFSRKIEALTGSGVGRR